MGAFSSEAFDADAFDVGAFDLATPTSTPDSTLAVIGIIQERGKGVLSAIIEDGAGVSTIMAGSFSVSSIIQTRGQGVAGLINEDGQGVSGEI